MFILAMSETMPPDTINAMIADILPTVRAFRRDLHAHPELAFAEARTAEKVRAGLHALEHISIQPPLIETDTVAILNPDLAGPCVALRADMDALPLTEHTDPADVPYRSTVPDVMHACGHDGHTAILLGSAMVLDRLAEQLPGKVKFIFQPAEEDGGGAGVLCERGVMTCPKVEAVFALHAWPARPVGAIALRAGSAMAANTPWSLTIHGKGCHGAYPHQGVDPVVVAAHLVTALQSIVARNVNPIDAAVVTVGSINAGRTMNIIPDRCQMQGTLRYLREEVGELLCQRMCDIVDHVVAGFGARADLRFDAGYPPVTNDPALAKFVAATGRELLGDQNVFADEPPSLGVEDFAYYGQQAPAVMFRLGVRPTDRDTYPSLHSPQFNFNDDALAVGIRMMVTLALRYFKEYAS